MLFHYLLKGSRSDRPSWLSGSCKAPTPCNDKYNILPLCSADIDDPVIGASRYQQRFSVFFDDEAPLYLSLTANF
jgi:hypothetical protein